MTKVETSASGRNYDIRRAGPADYAQLLPLFERFYREEGFDDAAAERIADNLRQLLTRNDTAAFVALAGEQAIGAAAASSAFGLEVGAYAELEDLFVDPDWRSGGAASALVEAVCDWAMTRGCSDVEIVLTPHAQAKAGLAAWYEARGFKKSDRVFYERSLG